MPLSRELTAAARDLIARYGINDAALAFGAALTREAEVDRRASGPLAEAHAHLALAVERAAAVHQRAEDLYYTVPRPTQAAHRTRARRSARRARP